MCEFVSWIKKDNDAIFLTGDDVFNSKRGKALQKHTCQNDWHGHGAIRWYYKFEGGTNKECTDFGTPNNFPSEIVTAIKAGKMRGLGISEQLLLKPAWAEYYKIKQAAWAESYKIEQAALVEYKKIVQLALVEYYKIVQPAWAESYKIKQHAFWDIFVIPSNRPKKWC